MAERQALTPLQQQLVRDALGLVLRVGRRVARRFPRARYDELVSVGQEALIDAARTFDPSRGVPFEGFAYIRVHGEMRDHGLREATPLSARLRRALTVGHAPATPEENSDVDAEVDDLGEARAWALDRATSLTIAYLLSSPLDDPETAVAAARDRERAGAALSDAIAMLAPDDAALTRAHYVDGRSLADLAADRGVAERTVQRHHRRILTQLRGFLTRSGVVSAGAST